MQYILVYVTTSGKAEAENIARAVLDDCLAACANIIEPMRSLYWWKGNLENTDEAVLLFKTELDRFERLKQKVCLLHSYETPCIVALPIIDGNRDYLDWITSSCNRNSK